MVAPPTFAAYLDALRERLGEPRRNFTWGERIRNYARQPSWCTSGDILCEQYWCRSFLFREGFIVWSQIVQANDMLYSPGSHNAPATVIYSFEKSWSDDLFPLMAMSRDLYLLKSGERFDHEETQYGQMLADEHYNALGWMIPSSICGTRTVRSTSVVIHRLHLPTGYLANSFLPIFAHPECRTVFVVPWYYWPQGMVIEFLHGG